MVRVTPSECDTTRLPSNGTGILAVADPLDDYGLKGRPCSSTKMRLPPPHIAQTLLPSPPQVRQPSLPCGMAARPAHQAPHTAQADISASGRDQGFRRGRRSCSRIFCEKNFSASMFPGLNPLPAVLIR